MRVLASRGLVLALLLTSAALAHGPTADDILGKVNFDPPVPVAGQTVKVALHLFYEADRHPVEDAAVELEISTGARTAAQFHLTQAGPGLYDGSFVAPDPRDYRLLVSAAVGDLQIRSDSGLKVVASAGDYAGSQAVSDRVVWFRPAGALKPATWTDAATWQLMTGGIVALALALWWRAGRGGNPVVAAGPNPIPPILLTVAAVGAFMASAGGYWDIAYHVNRGRESFWQPPHLLIYGGIVSTMLAVGVGLAWDRAAGRPNLRLIGARLREFPMLRFAMVAMVIQLSSAPFDEFWHATFGLDVSVWSPPHLFLIFGGMLTNLGLALMEADALRRGLSTAWWRMVAFAAGALGVATPFLAEFEFAGIPDWHISRTRPEALYAVVLALLASLALGIAARGARRWGATAAMSLFYLWRAAILFILIPLVGQNPPLMPPLALLPAALAFDWTVREAPHRWRYGLGGCAFAAVLFALYLPLGAVLPVAPVTGLGLAEWFPLAAAVGASAGYVGGRIGDHAMGTQDPEANPYHRTA